MIPSLEKVVELAGSLALIGDDRPQVLVDLEQKVDNGSLYYRFLYELSKKYGPLNFFEIGTYIGASAAHMALGHPQGRVLTVDINPDAKIRGDALHIPNLTCAVIDSCLAAELVASRGPLDVLYIDGNHTFNQMYGEYTMFRRFVKPGGLIIVDDIELKMATNEMSIGFDFIVDKKAKANHLHHTGFGFAVKTEGVSPRPWDQVIGEASARMGLK